MESRIQSNDFEYNEKKDLNCNTRSSPKNAKFGSISHYKNNTQPVAFIIDSDLESETETESELEYKKDSNKRDSSLPVKEEEQRASLYYFAEFPNDLKFLIPAFSCAVVAGVAKPVMSMLLGMVFTCLSRYSTGEIPTSAQFMEEVTKLCIGIIGLGFLSFFTDGLMLACFDQFSAHLIQRARRRVFVRFLNRDFTWYDTNPGVLGTLASFNQCFRDLHAASSMSLALVCQAICTIIVCFIFSFYYTWAVTLVAISTVPIMIVVSSTSSRQIATQYYNFKAVFEEAGTIVNWAVGSLVTVKQFNGHSSIQDRLHNILIEGSSIYMKFTNWAGIQQAITRFIVLGMFVPIFALGSYLVKKGDIEAGAVLTVFSCSFLISGSVAQLGLKFESIKKGQVGVARLKNFLNLGVSNTTYFKNMIGIFPSECYGHITFQNVSINFSDI